MSERAAKTNRECENCQKRMRSSLSICGECETAFKISARYDKEIAAHETEIDSLRSQLAQQSAGHDALMRIASDHVAALSAQLAQAIRERDEAKRCTHCKGSGRMMVQDRMDVVDGEWAEHTTEDECAQCEGKGQDR